MYLLGLDIGSSSVKAALVEAATGATLGVAHSPAVEMEIYAPQDGWAEQHPDLWWGHCCIAVKALLQQTRADPALVKGIGIAYQMHGLVAIDSEGNPVRPSIIWCDSRAVETGAQYAAALGESYCLEHYLNLPGNFTAAKLAWVKTHEPAIFERIHKIMLPGDYIAYRMSGVVQTTLSGLSEGILWDFRAHQPAYALLEQMGISKNLLPEQVPTFGTQATLQAAAATDLGLVSGTPIAYRAGDQPNNALALRVLEPGEVAATGGTSGVVYSVSDQVVADPRQGTNAFAHVNHTQAQPRIGNLLCINGAGILYSWMRRNLAPPDTTFSAMEAEAARIPTGAEGLSILPFGNGAERMLGNKTPGAHLMNLSWTQHGKAHLYRAGLEGIAFAFVEGMQMMQANGAPVGVIRVGNDNLFQSAIFSQTIADLLGCRIEMFETTGAVGAALGAGVGIGWWASPQEGLQHIRHIATCQPQSGNLALTEAYRAWQAYLNLVTL